MKRLLLCIAALFSLTICFGFKSVAASNEDIATLKQKVSTTIGVTISDSMATQVIDKWQTTGYINCWVNKTSGGLVQITLGNNYNMQNGNYYPQGGYINTGFLSPSDTSTLVWNNQSGSYVSGVSGYSCYVGKWEDFHTVPIDWDTVYYSANILPPELDITYRELSSVPIVDVPLNVELVAEPQNVYVEIGAVFECPDEVDAYSENGVYTYHALDTLGFAMTIIDKEDLFLASNASSSYIHLALNEAWQDVYDQIPMTDITWHTDPNYSTALVNNMKSRFENLRKVCCFYGNELKLFVRYFVINNDTQFVVGSWRIWNSRTPNSFTDQTPTWYQPYITASGTTGTSTNTGSNTQQDPDVITIPPGSGDPTGIYYNPTTNITVGSNVPNYPDYPTIRSYNADNFLVQTMNYLDYLNNDESEKTLFGEFGKFLATVFVFIPGEIWTIIAVGFSLVIVVMFLKIL